MSEKKEITDEQIFQAIDGGEFPESVIKSNKLVAVIMTQDWCPQWHSMNNWIYDVDDDNLDIYVIVYNEVDWFDKFMVFKEDVFNNDLIPYIRYYVDGELKGKSNFVNKIIFCENLGI